MTLTGSEKQIIWAESIISDLTANADHLVNNAKRHADLGGHPSTCNPSVEAAEAIKAFVLDSITKITSAAVVIDSRNKLSYDSLVKLACNYDVQHGLR